MPTEEQTILEEISRIVHGILDRKGISTLSVTPDSELLGGSLAIDSLDLAVLVRELEQVVGRDPFAHGFVGFRTVGDLAKLYLPRP
jgi:acyl carrier protein